MQQEFDCGEAAASRRAARRVGSGGWTIVEEVIGFVAGYDDFEGIVRENRCRKVLVCIVVFIWCKKETRWIGSPEI